MLFSEVIGQDAIKKRLLKTVSESRISHAQLFLGQEGSGKLALAIAYAQYINCHNKKNNDSCNECSSCRKFNKLVHPDLHFIYPTASTKEIKKPISTDFIREWRELVLGTNTYFNPNDWYKKIAIEKKQGIINVRDANEIIKRLSYKSYEAEYKVMIIWMAEKLFHSVAPKILKILEEPPEKTLFILISENQHQIINTILSRTQIIKLPPIKPQVLSKQLVKEGYGAKEVSGIVPIVNGNYLKAKHLLEKGDEENHNYNTFVPWMRLCYSLDMKDLSRFADQMNKNTRDANKNFLEYALNMVRNCLLTNYQHSDLIKLGEEEKQWLTTKFYFFINNENGLKIAEMINDAIYHIERNAHASILFFDLSLKIGRMLPRSIK